jgi:hypothetical protein
MSARHLILPAAVLFGLSACTPATPAAAPASTAPTSAAPISTAPTSTAAGSAAATAAASSPAPASAPPAATSSPSAARGCPSAASLEKLADLPAGWSFPAASVECWRDWAWAAPDGPNRGDGIYLFQHDAKGWRLHSEGSGYQCADLGITGRAPFCG